MGVKRRSHLVIESGSSIRRFLVREISLGKYKIENLVTSYTIENILVSV